MENRFSYLFSPVGWECNECGKRKPIEDVPSNYCSNCGAEYVYYEQEELIDVAQTLCKDIGIRYLRASRIG